MAVFPDRIVLKNSTDDDTTITNAIKPGGGSEIAVGEIVIGVGTIQAKLFTRTSQNTIVTISGTGGGGGGGGLVFWGGGNFTTGASDGQPPDGGLFT